MTCYFITNLNMELHGTPTVQFEAASPMMVSGPTGSGKTWWVNRLLSNDMFNQPVTSVLYCYGVYQEYYRSMTIPNVNFYEGLPTVDVIKSMHDGNFHVIVLDDLMEYIIKSIDTQNLFTKYCHHYNITAIFITQNVFAQGPCARSISLNTHVIILFANKRDEQQAHILGKQISPTNIKLFREAYADATTPSYGYLVIDCNPRSPPEFKFRTNIFPGEHTICYLSKEQ